MANEEHLKILKQGVEQWNKWRLESAIRPDLSGANLIGADLIGTDLIDAYLSFADLSGAYLIDANLSGANLSVIGVNRAAYKEKAPRGFHSRRSFVTCLFISETG